MVRSTSEARGALVTRREVVDVDSDAEKEEEEAGDGAGLGGHE